jgi:hypothetical protein
MIFFVNDSLESDRLRAYQHKIRVMRRQTEGMKKYHESEKRQVYGALKHCGERAKSGKGSGGGSLIGYGRSEEEL